MSNKKQFAINFIAQILFNIVNLGISFFLVPKIVESINASAYGFFSLSNDFINYAALITVALNSLAGRYITISLHKKTFEDANKYFNSVLFANIFISIITSFIGIIFIFFIEDILNIPIEIVNDVKILFSLVIMNFIINVIFSTFSVSTFATNKLYLNSILNIISQIIRCTLLIFAYTLLEPKVWYLGSVALLVTIIISLGNLYYTKKLIPELKINYKFVKIKYIIELTKAGIWNTVTRFSAIINNGLDLLIANLLIGANAMGILALPKSVHSIILGLFSSLGGIFAPKITFDFAKNNNDGIINQINFSFKFLGVFSNTVLVTFMVLGIYFFKLWVPTQDAELLYWIATISCMALIIGLPMEPFYGVHTALNKIKVPAIISIIFSITILILEFIGLILVKDTNIRLILISSTSSFVGLFRILFFLPIYTSIILKIKKTYFYKLIIKNTMAFIFSLIIGLFIKNLFVINTWITFLIACSVIAIITMLITININFNNYEKQEFIDIFKRKLLRK